MLYVYRATLIIAGVRSGGGTPTFTSSNAGILPSSCFEKRKTDLKHGSLKSIKTHLFLQNSSLFKMPYIAIKSFQRFSKLLMPSS